MKTKIVIYVENGCVTGILTDTAVEVTLVDWYVVNESDSLPTLPDGLEYDDDAGVRVVSGSWFQVAFDTNQPRNV